MRNGFFVAQRLAARQLPEKQQENSTFANLPFTVMAMSLDTPAGTKHDPSSLFRRISNVPRAAQSFFVLIILVRCGCYPPGRGMLFSENASGGCRSNPSLSGFPIQIKTLPPGARGCHWSSGMGTWGV